MANNSHRNSCDGVDKRFDSSHVLVGPAFRPRRQVHHLSSIQALPVHQLEYIASPPAPSTTTPGFLNNFRK
jgi:hypothetical protein